MQCYLSGHSDGSIDSVEPSTEGSSSGGTPKGGGFVPPASSMMSRDVDSGIGGEVVGGRPVLRSSCSKDSGLGGSRMPAAEAAAEGKADTENLELEKQTQLD